jgi:hypothetical protein
MILDSTFTEVKNDLPHPPAQVYLTDHRKMIIMVFIYLCFEILILVVIHILLKLQTVYATAWKIKKDII